MVWTLRGESHLDDGDVSLVLTTRQNYLKAAACGTGRGGRSEPVHQATERGL